MEIETETEIEIEKEEELSTYSETDIDTKSTNEYIFKVNNSISNNNFIQSINSSKYKLYQEQFISLFTKYNLEMNSIGKLISNYAKSKDSTITDIDYVNYIFYSENLITKIYKIKHFLKENKIDELINEIKSINENILNNHFLFILYRKKLLYYIQNNMVKESLICAEKYLAPLTKDDNILYKKLGDAMSLLAYEDINKCTDKDFVKECESINEDEVICLILRYFIDN